MAGRMQVNADDGHGRRLPASSGWRRLCVAALGLAGLAMTLAAGTGDRPGQPEPWVELEAVLRQQGIKTDLPSLREVARSGPDANVRWMAMEVLGLRRDQAARAVLAHVVKNDGDRLLRETAALALARLGDADGLSTLKGLMETAEPQRRVYLAARLAELNEPAGYAFVAEAVEGDNSQLKLLGIGNLAPFVPFEGRRAGVVINPIGRLLAVARHADPKIRKEALLNIPMAVVKGAPLTTFRPVVEGMAKADPDPDIREMARLTLVQWDKEARRKREKP